jgi:chromosomal replication initiation ATPase DnaA
MKEDVFNQYVERVLSLFNITNDEFFSKSRKRNFVDARHLVFFLCSRRNIQVTYIENFMKHNNHDIFRTSISHGIKSVSKKVEEDRDYKDIVNDIEKAVHI